MEKLRVKRKLVLEIIEDHILNYDHFKKMNSLINLHNEDKDQYVPIESQYNGINKLFTLQNINNENDRDKLIKMVYDVSERTAGEMSLSERAKEIERKWRQMVLDF